MTLTIIESYSTDLQQIGDLQVPSVCLAEDEDAIRTLVTNTPTLLRGVLERARDAGAQALLVVGGQWLWSPLPELEGAWEVAESQGTVTAPASLLSPVESALRSYAETYREREVQRAALEPFVHLHAHSEFSALDGLSTVDEMVSIAVEGNQPALAVTDHGICSGHPALQAASAKAGIRPIFGIEAYFVDDRTKRGVTKPIVPPEPKLTDFSSIEDARERTKVLGEARERWTAHKTAVAEQHAAAQAQARDYQHLILWAMDDRGLRNLWAMSTASYLEGFYGKPRMDWEVLDRYSEGVMASTACLRGPVAQAVLNDDEELARHRLGRLLGIFGDRLYAEIHTNSLEDQRRANIEILRLADEYGIPSIAAVDSHYPCADDQHAHAVWLSAQTNKELADDSGLFEGDEHYHLMGVDEVRSSLAYLPRVDEMIANTVAVAERCDAAIKPRLVMPLWSKPSVGDEEARKAADVERLVRLAIGTPEDGFANLCRYSERPGLKYPPSAYLERFETEMDLLVRKGFCGYFLMCARQVGYAKQRGILVGPGRGSGGGCLVAYLVGITAIDPVDADLLFERFLTEDRDDPPDFDVDYPSTYREAIQDFCTEEWGAEHTMRVGSIVRLKSRGVFSDLGRVFKQSVDYSDFVAISKMIETAEEGSAGLGLKWEELWAQIGDELEPYRHKYPEIFELAEKFRGRVKTYGRHAAGMVIAPDEVLLDNLPMRASENSNQPISQFDMDALTLLGYIKFDLLTLRTLDTLQMCIDLIREHRGKEINVYDWDLEYQDPHVWDEICHGHTLGIFQIETSSGTRLVRRFQPRSVSDLADVITLVRPGPVKSGLTESYFRRREGAEEVELPDPRLADVLAPTQGCIIYQEQVMKACQILGGYSLTEANAIRSMLGKKKVDKVQAAGVEFVARCSANGMAEEDAAHLWEQLGEFAKYSFNKSHAWAYAVVGYWTAWFKFHYPTEFLTAALSTVKSKRIPEFVNEARRMDRSVLPPDINDSGIGFSVTAQGCRYGFDGIDGLADASTNGIISEQPYSSFEDFMERKPSTVNKGHVKRLVQVGAFDKLGVNRRAVVERMDWDEAPEGKRCQFACDTLDANGLPCSFDWSSEPVKLGKTGRKLKNQPKPPARCTKACRNYTPPAVPDFDSLPDYTPAQIRDIEKELLGIYVSSTPFDWLEVPTPEHPDGIAAQWDRASSINAGPPGYYQTAAIIASARPYQSPRSGKMGFMSLACSDADLDAVLFSDQWAKFGSLPVGTMGVVDLSKNDRGLRVVDFRIMDPRD